VSVLVVGSVAFDTVRTPFGLATEVVGGSANYFAVAASFFTDVRLVAVVGRGLSRSASGVPPQPRGRPARAPASAGEDVRWVGEYGFDFNEAKTLDTQLNVLPTSLRQFHKITRL